MNEIELRNHAIDLLEKYSKRFKSRPHSFTPKEIAEEIGGAYSTLGKVADAVVSELKARGVRIAYRRVGNKRCFELL